MSARARVRALPNGAPSVRLRFLAQRLHELGSRSIHGLLGQILKGDDVVATLENYARFDPRVMEAFGGRDLPPPMRDITWTLGPR